MIYLLRHPCSFTTTTTSTTTNNVMILASSQDISTECNVVFPLTITLPPMHVHPDENNSNYNKYNDLPFFELLLWLFSRVIFGEFTNPFMTSHAHGNLHCTGYEVQIRTCSYFDFYIKLNMIQPFPLCFPCLIVVLFFVFIDFILLCTHRTHFISLFIRGKLDVS